MSWLLQDDKIIDLKLLRSALAPKSPFRVEPNLEQSSVFNIFFQVPPCDTETYYEGYEKFLAFRDIFINIYINQPKLFRTQKLYHLRYKT